MTYDSQSGAPLDATEQLVHKRFESAVASLHLDVPSLVNGGLAAGARLAHRRRLQQVGAAVAGVAIIAVGGVAGVRGGLFDTNATPPANRGITELVPATSRGFAAAVIADLPSGIEVSGNGGVRAPGKAVEADLKLMAGSRSVDLAVAASLPHLLPTTCKGLGHAVVGCESRTLPNGDRVVTGAIRQAAPGGARGRMVLLVRPTALILVFETAKPATSSALPLSDDQLLAVATDPLVGLQTSRAMVEAGGSLESFTESAEIIGTTGSSSSSGSSSGSGSTPVPPGPSPSVPSRH